MKLSVLRHVALKSAACIALFLGSYTLANAETIEGVLEQSGANSALFSLSPASGDLIGYPFKSNSSLGKAVLTNCLPGLVCRIGKATTRLLQDQP